MAKNRFTLRLPQELKDKLIRDSILHNFSTSSAYLQELIKHGLPTSKSLDLRLKLIENEIKSLKEDVTAFNNRNSSLFEKIFKRVHLIYRVVGYALARTFYIKSGPVSPGDIEDANAIIKDEVEELEKNHRE